MKRFILVFFCLVLVVSCISASGHATNHPETELADTNISEPSSDLSDYDLSSAKVTQVSENIVVFEKTSTLESVSTKKLSSTEQVSETLALVSEDRPVDQILPDVTTMSSIPYNYRVKCDKTGLIKIYTSVYFTEISKKSQVRICV